MTNKIDLIKSFTYFRVFQKFIYVDQKSSVKQDIHSVHSTPESKHNFFLRINETFVHEFGYMNKKQGKFTINDCEFFYTNDVSNNELVIINNGVLTRSFDIVLLFVTNSIISECIHNYHNLTKKEQNQLVIIDERVLQFIKDPTEESIALHKMKFEL